MVGLTEGRTGGGGGVVDEDESEGEEGVDCEKEAVSEEMESPSFPSR